METGPIGIPQTNILLVSHITKQLIGPGARVTVTINANDIQKQYRLITKANEGGIIFFIGFT